MFSGQIHLPTNTTRLWSSRCPSSAPQAASQPRLAAIRLTATTDTVALTAETAHQEHCIKIFYRSAWKNAWLHGSLSGGPWQNFPLKPVPSAPGLWLVADIKPVADKSLSAAITSVFPALEFVATNGYDWDKTPDGGNYHVSGPGHFSVRGGKTSRVAGEAVLVVSDLDGTMVGDDTATRTFKTFWEEEAVIRGGVLAYNTGRSLDSFVKLLNEKRHCLAHPDVLISAVGTQIYNYDGRSWQADRAWAAMLDDGWKIDAVREAAYKALSTVGFEKMHFRPADEQNSHKITCGVHVSVLPQVLESVASSLAAGSVTANLITSGTGDWRFLDIVAKMAGKLEALHYVRKQHGFPVRSAIACGDSGNDILMLSGENPAIVVSNAQPDLRSWVEAQEAAGGTVDAAGQKRLLVTGKHEAYGILEGLEFFGFK